MTMPRAHHSARAGRLTRLAASLAATLLTAACGARTDPPAAAARERPAAGQAGADGTPVVARSLSDADGIRALLANDGGLDAPARLVVRDDVAWAAVWAQMAGRVRPTPPAPAVDFAREMLLVAAGGPLFGGADIAITGVSARPDSLVALVLVRTGLWPGCTTDGGVRPAAVVRVARDPRSVAFREAREDRECVDPRP